MANCKGCGRFILLPEGPQDASILLVGEAPSQFDIKEARLWTGDFGDLLRAELRKQRILYHQCRITNMWLHPKTKECDFEKYHVNDVLREMENRTAILLLGAETTKYFTGYNISEVSGLRVDTLPHREGRLIPSSVGMVFALFNPAIVLHEKLGELRFGLQRFSEALNGTNT